MSCGAAAAGGCASSLAATDEAQLSRDTCSCSACAAPKPSISLPLQLTLLSMDEDDGRLRCLPYSGDYDEEKVTTQSSTN